MTTASLFSGLLLFTISIYACNSNHPPVPEQSKLPPDEVSPNTFFDPLLAEGFDFPVGNENGQGYYVSLKDGKTYDSWYIATAFNEKYSLGIHPGEDWNGTGGGNTDQGQPVYAIGKGLVVAANNFGYPWGNVVFVKHKYLENGKILVCFSLYAHLEAMSIKVGDTIVKRQQLGTIGTGEGAYPAHLHMEIRKSSMDGYKVNYWPCSNSKNQAWISEQYENPSGFIKIHRKIQLPTNEKNMIIAIKGSYKLYFYSNGVLQKKYEIALSQNPEGSKEEEGDLKMPEGNYYIVEKQKGPFSGPYARFLGNYLLRISYPNEFDAICGFNKGLISNAEKTAIIKAAKSKQVPPKNTKLGGGIVIHGWAGEWTGNGQRNLTWGCISMHNKDLEEFYEFVPVGTRIIIVP